jgi:hypothetical protein
MELRQRDRHDEVNPVQENQQMLMSVFIILIKLPRHVSAANCHLQGVTCSLQATPVFSAPRVDVGYGSFGVTSHRGGRNVAG